MISLGFFCVLVIFSRTCLSYVSLGRKMTWFLRKDKAVGGVWRPSKCRFELLSLISLFKCWDIHSSLNPYGMKNCNWFSMRFPLQIEVAAERIWEIRSSVHLPFSLKAIFQVIYICIYLWMASVCKNQW